MSTRRIYKGLTAGIYRGAVLIVLPLVLAACQPAVPESEETCISEKKVEGGFPLSTGKYSAAIYVSSEDYPGVARVAELFREDIGRVTGTHPELITDGSPLEGPVVLIGTAGQNPLIDRLAGEGKLDLSGIEGKWEAFQVEVIRDPYPGVEQALVIAGSDKRGTIYGMFDLSYKMGVSPWYWWADVPVKKKKEVYVKPGRYLEEGPAVKYRGIFINDEAPALSGWVHENYGAFNAAFYEHVFELILRLKGNYLWPAMWGRAFYDDDPASPKLADLYGIVIGTSHHEPLMRAHVEWRRYGSGPWNYEKNKERLKAFWREGIERMDDNESIVTIGMRGDGDEPMTQGTAIALLERIVADQREILEEVTGKKASEIPQMWALYKEVQDYYDKGMRVPDDVTLLLCDDNWGNIRKLPGLDSMNRPGGYGIYYHFDYVGGPRNYKWLNTNQIERVWEQMHLALKYGADRLWVVNVGDIKPMEFPIEFFLDYAWAPSRWPAERLPDYYRIWAGRQFGSEHAEEIASQLARYTRFNSRRKPELLSPGTYSLVNYREAERIMNEYNALAGETERLYDAIPAPYRDAYFELVYFPVQACSNLNELYVTAGRNRLYAEQGRAATNGLARKVEELFARDSNLTARYHSELAGGKWDHMMSQTHIGYTYWQEPRKNTMPEVREIKLPQEALMGVSPEGTGRCWPGEEDSAGLPGFDPWNRQEYTLDVFNRGSLPFDYRVDPGEEWIRVIPLKGRVEKETRLKVSIDWKKAPEGEHASSIGIHGSTGEEVTVFVILRNPSPAEMKSVRGFIESNGTVSIEAAHYSRAIGKDSLGWKEVAGLGRTLSAMMPVPVTAPPVVPGGDSPVLEYDIYLFSQGKLRVKAYLSPTLNFHNDEGLEFAVSIDDETPQVINMHAVDDNRTWEGWVSNNIHYEVSEHFVEKPGPHTLKFWRIDPGVVLQKLEVITGQPGQTYLGPPESAFAEGNPGEE